MKNKFESTVWGSSYESDNGDTSAPVWVSTKPATYTEKEGLNMGYFIRSEQIIEVHNEYFKLNKKEKKEILDWLKSFIKEQKKLLSQ